MKLTKSYLKQLIKEEFDQAINESRFPTRRYRRVKTFGNPPAVQVYWDKDWDEYVVAYEKGRTISKTMMPGSEETDYHTDDQEDAYDTARQMAKDVAEVDPGDYPVARGTEDWEGPGEYPSDYYDPDPEEEIYTEPAQRPATTRDAFDDYWDRVDQQYDGVLTTRFGAEKENYREKYNKGWRYVRNDYGANGWYSASDRQAYGFEEEDPYYDPDEPYGGDIERRIGGDRDRGDIYRGESRE